MSELIDEVKQLGIHSPEGRSKLISAKEYMLEHFNKENEQLYPVLNKEAEDNKELQNELDMFALDSEHLTNAVHEFFDDYSGGGADKAFR